MQRHSILSQSHNTREDIEIESTAALVSPRKNALVHRDIPTVPKPWGAGQDFAASEILSLGIAQEDKAAMKKFYKAHDMFCFLPSLTQDSPRNFFWSPGQRTITLLM